MDSEGRVPIRNFTSSVMRRTLPSLRGWPSSPSTARGESQGVSFSLCCKAKSCYIKLLAAPESIRAVLVIILARINNLTGKLMIDAEVS